MDIIKSKFVKGFIMDPSNDLEEIVDFLEVDFKETIAGIFNALFTLLRHYSQNQSRVDYLVDLLEQLVEIKSIDELQNFIGPIQDFDNKILENFKLKQRIAIQKPYNRINDLFSKINQKKLNDIHNGKAKCLEYLIFQEKNITMIESFLSTYSNILNSRNKDGDNIFAILIKHYLFLDEKNQEEIDYFYHIIILFINSKYGKTILKEKEIYLRIIRRSKLSYKEHIVRLIELFDPEFSISLSEIEDRYKIKFEIPSIILNEMNTFRMDNQGRVDFTYQDCVTIDGATDQCLDDALYIEKNLDGSYTLYIHITDIPSFVPYSSLTNEEARKRIETIYLRDRRILLYPENISECLCSLLPHNNRNVISFIFKLDNHFDLMEDEFQVVKGKICSKHKFSYDEVDAMIKNFNEEEISFMLRRLFCFADKRRKQNMKKEEYRQYENFLSFETHHESLKVDYSPSANIVHEAMVLVNYRIAKYFKELSLPYIYRKVDVPSNDFIEQQFLKIQKLDPNLKGNKEFLAHLQESYMETLYSAIPVHHRGLNLECYSHSSSPARRYSDAYGQYLIYEFLFLEKMDDINIKTWEYRTKDMVSYLNEKKKMNEIFASQYNYLSYKKLIKQKKK